jgi:uncharacterized protein (TIGR03067 family)
MRVLITTIAVFALLGVVAAQDVAKEEKTRLEGEWSMVSGEINGQSMPDQLRQGARRVAKEGETTVTINGQIFMKAKYSIDATKKPKTIDYLFTDGPTKGQKQLGIYELEGETVKFCFAAPGKVRPDDFTSKPGSGRTLSVWKRSMK